MSTQASPFFAAITAYGSRLATFWISRSVALRPINRFAPNTVRCGFVTIWRLLAAPTTTSPSAFHDTIDGVVRPPSWLWMTVASPPSSTATQEFVVPRSIPMTRPIAQRAVYLSSPSEQLGERGLGELQIWIELQRVLKLDARLVDPSRDLRLAPLREREQRAIAHGLRRPRDQRLERHARGREL